MLTTPKCLGLILTYQSSTGLLDKFTYLKFSLFTLNKNIFFPFSLFTPSFSQSSNLFTCAHDSNIVPLLSSHNFTVTLDSSFFLFQILLVFLMKQSPIVPATFWICLLAAFTSDSPFFNNPVPLPLLDQPPLPKSYGSSPPTYFSSSSQNSPQPSSLCNLVSPWQSRLTVTKQVIQVKSFYCFEPQYFLL